MRYFVVCLLTCSFAAPALAQQDEGRIEFINLGEITLNGERMVPKVLRFEGEAAVKHQKLLDLKKDFLPLLQATAKDVTFR